MPTVDRIPVLVYDDGSPGGALALDRALEVASSIVMMVDASSPNHTRNVTAADQADIPITVERLAPHSGVRHALVRCADDDIHLALVPRPGGHPGQHLRKIVQAAAECQRNGHGVLAVSIVHPDSALSGPVVELDQAHSDSGFAALFAAGLAGTTGCPLHIVRLPGDRTGAPVRDADALDRARQLIADREIAVFDEAVTGEPIATSIDHANGASSVVFGLGGFAVRGRKMLAPDELPDAVLETSDGRLAHALVRDAPADVVLVLDAIDLEHGHVARAVALAAAVGAVTAGIAVQGLAGLAISSTGVGVAIAGYRAVQHVHETHDEPDDT